MFREKRLEEELKALRAELEIYKNNNAWCYENLKIINNPDTNAAIQSFGYRDKNYPSGPGESFTIESEIYVKYKDCNVWNKIYYDLYEQSEDCRGNNTDISHYVSHETLNLSDNSISCILSFIKGDEDAMRIFSEYLKDIKKEKVEKVKCI